MKKLKWKYNIQSRKWYTAYALFVISKDCFGYFSLEQNSSYISDFRKLKDAKRCAQIIHNG